MKKFNGGWMGKMGFLSREKSVNKKTLLIMFTTIHHVVN